MTRQELKEALTGKSFIFNRQLVAQLGGKRKGGKAQNIEEILGFYDTDADKVVSGFETLELTKASRFAHFKSAIEDIRGGWEAIVRFVDTNENVPEQVREAIDKIDSFIDAIFGK